MTGEKQALLKENRILEGDRDELRDKLRDATQENVQIKERRVNCEHSTHKTLHGISVRKLKGPKSEPWCTPKLSCGMFNSSV